MQARNLTQKETVELTLAIYASLKTIQEHRAYGDKVGWLYYLEQGIDRFNFPFVIENWDKLTTQLWEPEINLADIIPDIKVYDKWIISQQEIDDCFRNQE
jgi:hypothetical protein